MSCRKQKREESMGRSTRRRSGTMRNRARSRRRRRRRKWCASRAHDPSLEQLVMQAHATCKSQCSRNKRRNGTASGRGRSRAQIFQSPLLRVLKPIMSNPIWLWIKTPCCRGAPPPGPLPLCYKPFSWPAVSNPLSRMSRGYD